MASASDVPSVYDLVVAVSGGATTGFVFDDAVESSLPFRTHKAVYTTTPTFIERQNVQGDYGDDQQDFWMTATQRDWSEGEQQRYFRPGDADSTRRYWQGTNVDVSEPGKASIRALTNQTTAFGAAIVEMAGDPLNNRIWGASVNNLYEISSAGTITDRGGHGLGTTPSCMSTGGSPASVYLSGTGGISVGTRLWNGAAFSTFSATTNNSLAFLNNTLYGLHSTTADTSASDQLVRFDTAGVATTLFTWKDAAGNNVNVVGKLATFGGKLLILRAHGEGGSELWIYDGTGTSLIGRIPNGFVGLDVAEIEGTVFVGGYFAKRLSGATYVKPAIFYYSNGSIGLHWKANSFVASTSAREARVCGFQGGLVFTDDTVGSFMFYDPGSGGISTLGSYTFTDQNPRLASSREFFLHSRAATQPYRHPADGFSTSATVVTSLFDFDSSLTKLFRGIKIEFDSATDGNGGSADISYRVGDVDGSYTSLQTGATSGTEYTLSGVSGRSISIKVTLNKGTSTSGSVLKHIFVRGAPILTRFKNREYILNCTGNPGTEDRLLLRDGSSHPLSGRQQVDQLILAAASQSALTITDRFGSYTGIIETLEIYEEHPSKEVDPSLSGTFVCKVTTREI